MTELTISAPPVARKEHKETTLHGVVLADDYAWLRDKENPDVTAYLEAENAYAEAVMAPLAALREELYREMLSHIKQTDVSVSYRDGGWWYYSRTEEGQQYGIYCRKRGGPTGPDADAAEEVVLDGNELAKGHAFFSIGDTGITDDGRWLAYTSDTTGFRQYTLHIKDLATGETLADEVERVGSVVWAADNRTLFYTVEDEQQKRQYRLYRGIAGKLAEAALVFEEDDERFNIAVGRTRDGKYLMLESASHTTSEARILKSGDPTGSFSIIAPREDEHEYSLDHRNGLWFIRTNDRGRNFRLVTAPVETPGREHWTELIAHREQVMLEDVALFAGFFMACEREDGLPRLRLWKFASAGPEAVPSGEITFPEPAYSAHPHINRIFDTTIFRYGYESLVTPDSVYEFAVATGESTLLKQREIPGGFDRTLYASERIRATAPDGVVVPTSIVYRKDRRTESNPLYVYGYGSYGYALPLGFSSNRLSLLDRGVVMAYAHIRGGGDLGKPWHDAGKMLLKRNTFTDFIACVEHLTAAGYGDAARVAIEGGSAGGLLMGAVANMRPELFRAVLSHVPFVDVMNTMLDASLPLTVPEYEEWGDPNQEEFFRYMLSYSPYDNLHAASYPAMLVKTSLHDSQVMYWEPAKYVAKLRTLNHGSHPLLLVTNMQAGHGGSSGRYDYLNEIALDYAFVLRELGIAGAPNEAETAQGFSITLGDPAEQARFVKEYGPFLMEWRELRDVVEQIMLGRTINSPDMTPFENVPDDDPVLLATEDRYKADLSCFVLARTAIDDFNELLTLASNGFGIGALKILRGMYERIVTSAYVAFFPEVSRSLAANTWTHNWNVWRRATAMRPELESSVDPSDVEVLQERAREAQALHRESFCKACKQLIQVHAWTKVDLETMAKKVDERTVQLGLNQASLAGYYLRCYLQPTALEHATGTSINEKFELVGDHWTYKMDSSKERRQALLFGHALLLSLLSHQNHHFGYGLAGVLGPRNAALRRVWGLPSSDESVTSE